MKKKPQAKVACPYCGEKDSRVTDSRESADGFRRRRECDRCYRRFSTLEKVAHFPHVSESTRARWID